MKNIESGKLIIFTGPSGSGKDTLQTFLCNQYSNIRKIVTTTTRPRRDKEIEGVDYEFLTLDDFIRETETERFLDVNKYNGHYYAVHKNKLLSVLEGKKLTLILNMSTIPRLNDIFSKAYTNDSARDLLAVTKVIFVGVSRLYTLKQRFIHRQSQAKRNDISARLHDDWNTWLEHRKVFTNIVINDNGSIEKAFNEVKNIISE